MQAEDHVKVPDNIVKQMRNFNICLNNNNRNNHNSMGAALHAEVAIAGRFRTNA